MISEKLKDLIENLYSTFSKYEINSKIDGCPCCVSDRDKERIHDKKLRDLENEDLSRYAFKAMTTWGNVNDFKHFLPRIFELLVENKLVVGSSTILGKLEYGNWKDWESTEQEFIRVFLFEWWNNSILSKNYFDDDLFFGIYKLTNDLDKLLDCWKVDFKADNFIVFVRFIDDYYQDLIFKKSDFKNLNENDFNKLFSWIQLNSKFLEEGFYHFENINKQFARDISDALYIFEHSKA